MAKKIIDLETGAFPRSHIENYQRVRSGAVINILALLFDGVSSTVDKCAQWGSPVLLRDFRSFAEHKWVQRTVSSVIKCGGNADIKIYHVYSPAKGLGPQLFEFTPFDAYSRSKISFITYNDKEGINRLIGVRIKREKRLADKEFDNDVENMYHNASIGAHNHTWIKIITHCVKFVDYVIWADNDSLALTIFCDVLALFCTDIATDALSDNSVLRNLWAEYRGDGQNLALDLLSSWVLNGPASERQVDFYNDPRICVAFGANIRRLMGVCKKGLSTVDNIARGVILRRAAKIGDAIRIDKSALDPDAVFPPISDVLRRILDGSDKDFVAQYRRTMIPYIKTRANLLCKKEHGQSIKYDNMLHWAYARAITTDPAHAAVVVVLYYALHHLNKEYEHKLDCYIISDNVIRCDEWLCLCAYVWWRDTVTDILSFIKKEGTQRKKDGVIPKKADAKRWFIDLKDCFKFFARVCESPHFPKGPPRITATMNWVFGLVLSLLCVADTSYSSVLYVEKFANNLLRHIGHLFTKGESFDKAAVAVPFRVAGPSYTVKLSISHPMIRQWVLGNFSDTFYRCEFAYSELRGEVKSHITAMWDNVWTFMDWEDPSTCSILCENLFIFQTEVMHALQDTGVFLQQTKN